VSGIYSPTPRLSSVITAREELIHSSSPENATEVQEDLKDLNDKCVLFWIAENWALNCSAKPIIELDIHYIGQPEISRLVDVTGICKWLLSSFCYWNYCLNSISVQQQHCHCVHHKWMLSHAHECTFSPFSSWSRLMLCTLSLLSVIPFSNESMFLNFDLHTLDWTVSYALLHVPDLLIITGLWTKAWEKDYSNLVITPLTHSYTHVHTHVSTHVGGSEGSHCQKTQRTGCPGEGKAFPWQLEAASGCRELLMQRKRFMLSGSRVHCQRPVKLTAGV